ncbi:MAG: 50S ribosomal protein L35 [Rhodospirillaceae bacterium]|nr:MAG: 50S ribosomal protein L35 [Rhodospirillaceae bacterium]
MGGHRSVYFRHDFVPFKICEMKFQRCKKMKAKEMTKLKTKKAAQKRFSMSKHLGIKRAQANRTHKLRKKAMSCKRPLRNQVIISRSNESSIKQMLPYLN